MNFTSAFYLYKNIHNAHTFIKNNFNQDIKSVTVEWDYNSSVKGNYWLSCTVPLNLYIYLIINIMLQIQSIMNMAHHVMNTIYDSNGGDMPLKLCVREPHNELIISEPNCAWVEGFAEFFAQWVSNSSLYIFVLPDATEPTIINYEDRTQHNLLLLIMIFL